MKRLWGILIILVAVFNFAFGADDNTKRNAPQNNKQSIVSIDKVTMPSPDMSGKVPLEQILALRGKETKFSGEGLTFGEVAQLLWAGYGLGEQGGRTLDSYDEAYPLALYVITTKSVYKYDPQTNTLEIVYKDDVRSKLALAARKDKNVYESVFNIVIAGSEKLAGYKIPRNARKYMLIEAGKAAQNIELQAVSLKMAVASTSNFDEAKVKILLRMPAEFEPISILTIDKVTIETEYAFKLPEQLKAEEVKPKTPKKPKKVVIIIPSEKFLEEDFFNVDQALELANIETDIASFTLNQIRGDLRGTVIPDILVGDVYADNYDGVILVGGLSVLRVYDNERLVSDIVSEFDRQGKVVGALGRTPSVLAINNIVRGRYVTSNPGVRRNLEKAGAIWTNAVVEVSNNLITGQGVLGTSKVSSSEGASGAARFASEFVRSLTPSDEDETEDKEEVEGVRDRRFSPYDKRENWFRRKFE